MHDSYVDGFCLKLENILDREKIKEVANLLYIYSIDYEIKPIKNNIIVFEYKLPNAYYIYMAAKEHCNTPKDALDLLFRSGKINQEQYNTFARML